MPVLGQIVKRDLSPWRSHVNQWNNCTLCPLHKTRSHVVLARGKIPCDVLFVGEAPGISEDAIGLPMIGPAGKLLDQIIEQSLVESSIRDHETGEERQIRWAITNLLGCIPMAEGGGKVKEANDFPEDCVLTCRPRLEQFIEISSPRLIVAVGRKSCDWLEPGYTWSVKLPHRIPTVDIMHPAAILREPIAKRSFSVHKCVMTIIRALEDHLS